MKPHLDIAHHGTLTAEDRVGMTFDEDSIAHLMSILTDLYSDPELAVIREYSTNGSDSHSRAGIDKPIEVSLPNDLNPMFVVKDYGVGMSAKEIYENFSKYGWSSKRDTDTEAGMLGLGCKAGLTYTSQFTMVCNKDGIQNVVLVTRQESGAGAVQIIHTDETDDPDGVEVRVPVANAARFRQRAYWFYRFWDRGTVLVDDAEPQPWEESANIHLDPDVFITTELETDYFVMGNVPYPIPEPIIPRRGYGWTTTVSNSSYSTTTASYFNTSTATTTSSGNTNISMRGSNHYNAVFKVAIGDVNFTPSREALQMTKRTREAIHVAKTFVQNTFHRNAQEEVNDAASYYEAMETAERWDNVWNTGDYTYRGLVVPRDFHLPNTKWENLYDPDGVDDKNYHYAWEWDTNYKSCSKLGSFTYKKAYKVFHVIGHTNKAVHAGTKDKVLQYLASIDKENDFREVYFYPSAVGSPWLDDVPQVHYDVIRGYKPTVKRQRTEGWRFLVHNGSLPIQNGTTPDAFTISSDIPSGREDLFKDLNTFLNTPHFHVAFIPKDRVKKFQEEFPGVPEFKTWIVEQGKVFLGGLSDLDKLYLKDSYKFNEIGIGYLAEALRVNALWARIQDPDLCELVTQFRGLSQNGRNGRYNALQKIVREFSIPPFTLEPDAAIMEKLKIIHSRYGLMTDLSRYRTANSETTRALLNYINGQYLLSQLGFTER